MQGAHLVAQAVQQLPALAKRIQVVDILQAAGSGQASSGSSHSGASAASPQARSAAIIV